MTTVYAASNQLPMSALPTVSGIVQQFPAKTTNPSDATYAPDGLAAAPIFGLGGQQLQGNEIVNGGNVKLVSYIGPLLNSGDLCWVLLECTGGAQQVAPAVQSKQAVQFGQVSGVVGAVRNLAASIATASASATLTADEIIVESALGGLRYCLSSFSQTINLATTGAGGMDKGSAPVSGFVAMYAIYNPITNATALLGTNATSAKAPEVYGGANMPDGYTASALVSVWATNSSGQLTIGNQVDRRLSFPTVLVLDTATPQSTPTSLSIAAAVPKNARRVSGNCNPVSTVTASLSVQITADAARAIGLQYINCITTGFNGMWSLDLITPQTLFYKFTASAGSASTTITVVGYEF